MAVEAGTPLWLLVVLVFQSALAAGLAAADPLMHQVATEATRPAGAPGYSDVCLRYGWVRTSFPTVDDAREAVAGFHATRVDWFYPGSHVADGTHVIPAAQDFIEWCHARGMEVGGSINTLTENLEWRLLDGSFGRYVGDPFNPDYVAAAVAWGADQIDAGVDTLVCDDFFYYPEAAQQTQFSTAVIAGIKSHQAGFKVAANHGGNISTAYVADYEFDFRYADANFNPTPGDWWSASKAHRALDSAVITHPNISMSKWDYRLQMALGYATGCHVMAPWDEYIHGGDRFFGDPADFADVTAFTRCLGQHGYLNEYEDAAVGGYDLDEDRYPTDPLEIVSGNDQLSLFARARPGRAGAAVIVHLIRWAGSGSTRIKLLTESFFGGAPLVISLWTRKPFAASEHTDAEGTGDFSLLRWDRTGDITVTDNGAWTEVDIPELHPWGVLIVTTEEDRTPPAAPTSLHVE